MNKYDFQNFTFGKFMKIIKSLKNEEQITDFVKERINYLENDSIKRDISFDYKNNAGTINEGYINSESPITTSLLVEPFYMNDITIYIEFIKHIKDKDITDYIHFLEALRDFTKFAFGFKGNQARRINVYTMDRKEELISIADFYQNYSALCSERSAAVQNIASLCGVNSYMIIGNLKTSTGNEEVHSFNVFKTGDGTLILFDPTNPVALDINGCVGYAPAFRIIGNSIPITELEKVELDFDDLSQIYKNPIHSDEQERMYYFPLYSKKKNNQTNNTANISSESNKSK